MELFQLFGKIAIDNTEAKTAIDETTKKAKDAEKETSGAFSKIGSAASTLGKGVLGVGAAMGGAFVAAVEGTREYRTQMGLLESAFTTAGHTSEEAKNTYSDLNAVIGDTEAAVEASQHIALLADNEKEMNQWTDICTGVFATFGASLPVEGLTEAANHTAELGEVQGSLADALEWSGITVDDFNKELEKCNTVEERQDLITKTLSETYKDAADQYKETNKDVMEAQKANERLTDAFAEVGAVCEPIMTAIKNAIADMAEKAAPMIQTLIDKTKDMITWFKENQSTVQTWVGVILGASAAIGTFLLIMNWSSIMAAASKAIQGVRLAVTAFNAALMANPIGIIVGLLVGLTATFIYLWNNVDGFKQFWIDTWEIIKESASEAWEWIKKSSSDAWKWIVGIWNSVGEWFSGQFDEIAKLGKDCMDAISDFFSKGWKMAKNAWSSAVSFFVSIWNRIKANFSTVVSFYGDIFKKAWNAIVNVWNHAVSFYVGIWKGIQNAFKSTASWFGNIFKNAWNSIVNVWNSAKSYFQKIWEGIRKIFSVAKSVLSNYFSDAWNGIKKIWNNTKSFFSGIWTGIKNVFGSVGSWFGNIFSQAWSRIKNVFSGWGTFFGGLWDKIKSKFSSIGSTLGSTMSNAVKTGMNSIIGKIESTINKGLGLINKAIRLANKLGFSVGEVGELSLPRLAKGAIVKGSTPAIVGEDGAEAIIPLEHNTQWIDRIADRLNQSLYDVDTISLLKRIIILLENMQLERNIYLDSGVLVGELTPAIDRRLGYIATKKNRGNI